MDFEDLIKKLENFVSNYDILNDKINLKYIHSIKVAEKCEEIAVALKLDEEKIYLAKLIGLLHDIGRFEQVKLYNTFKDIEMDHADYGVKILFEDGLIRNFITDNKYDNIIKCAIESHNKFSIPWYYKDDILLFTKILRDADKIDIYRILSKRNEKFLDKPDNFELNQFLNMNQVKIDNSKNNKSNDILIHLGLIFDINFSESIKILKNNGYFEDFVKSIEVSKENAKMFKKIQKIIKKFWGGKKYDR